MSGDSMLAQLCMSLLLCMAALYGGHALIVSLTPSLSLSISARYVSMCLCLSALSVQLLSMSPMLSTCQQTHASYDLIPITAREQLG